MLPLRCLTTSMVYIRFPLYVVLIITAKIYILCICPGDQLQTTVLKYLSENLSGHGDVGLK